MRETPAGPEQPARPETPAPEQPIVSPHLAAFVETPADEGDRPPRLRWAHERRPELPSWHRHYILVVIGTAAIVGAIFHLLQLWGLNHTGLVFVGIPAVLAVAVAYSTEPRSSTGVVLKATTLALLIAGTVLGEAFICLLMASPLIYLIVLMINHFGRKAEERLGPRGAAYAPLLMLIAAAVPAMEGVTPALSLRREASVEVTRTVPATPGQVRDAIARPLRFDQPLPAFLRIGFPTPGMTSGSGLNVGDVRRVMLVHGHHHSEHSGELVMRVSEARPGRVVFTPVSDGSYVVHWLSWQSAEVRWRAVPGGTEVRWTLRYRRRLDPAWYFGPLETYGARVAAGYLVESVATPRGGR